MRVLVALAVAGAAIGALPGRALPDRPAAGPEKRLPEPTRVLAGAVLHESDALAAPTEIEVMGGSLVIADDFADRPLRVLRRSDGRLQRSFGGRGRGPREFESAWSIDVVDPAGEFVVHDVVLQRLTWVDLERDFEGGRWTADRSVQLGGDGLFLEVAWNGGGLIALGVFPAGRLARLDGDGVLLRTAGPTPLDEEKVAPEVRMQAYEAHLEANPSRTRWAVAARFADRLEIYDRAGTLVALGAGPRGFEPPRPTRRGRMATPADVRFAYLDIAATEARVYALFSGRTRAAGRANFGSTVHVFDWSGALLEVLGLDADLIALAADPAGRLLYGVRHDPAPAVLVYDLGP